MNRDQKAVEIKSLAEGFLKSKGIIFALNKGLTVAEVTELRRNLRKESNRLKVVKNRLAKRALKEVGIEGLDAFFKGPATITSAEVDPVSAAKVLIQFSKDHEKLEVQGGFVYNQILDLNKVKALASLPSREELYAKLLYCISGTATQLVNVLSALPRGMVNVVDAIRRMKEKN